MLPYYSFGKLRRQLARLTPALAVALLTTTAAQAQTASFATAATYGSGGNNPNDVALGDVNGDGRLDIVTANFNSATIGVLLGQPGGSFGSVTTYGSGGSNPAFVALGDVNGDGRPDIVTANRNSATVGVLLGLAGGGFGTAATYGSGGTNPIGVALGDLNVDGRLDIVTTNTGTNTVGVLLGQASGGFATATTYGSGGNFPFGVAIGSLNGDTRPDIVVSNSNSNTVGVLLGQASGGFATATTYGSGGTSPTSLRLGDANSDGRPDILTANLNSATVGVLLGQAGGSFGTAATYGSGGTRTQGVALGDVNGDGRPDLVAANYDASRTVGVLLGQASGGFAAATTFDTGGTSISNEAYEVELGDVNGDARPDIVVSNISSHKMGVLLNTASTAPFLSSASPTSGPVGTSVTLTGARLSGATAVSFNGTAASTFSGVNDGTITATVPTGATTGNVTVTTSAGTSNGVAFAVNPTVVISSSAGTSGGSTGTTPIPFTITFSQPVTGFVTGDVAVTNGTISSFSGSGTTYSITVTPTTPGTATTVSIAANVAQASAGTGNTASSAPFSITFNAPVTATTWTGAVSTDWYANANWTNGMPGRRVNALIPAGVPNFPVVSTAPAYTQTLTLASGATLTQTGGTLELRGDFSNSGTFTATGGTVSLRDSLASQRIGGNSRTTLWNLTVGASGAGLDGEVDIQRVLTLNGNLSTASLGLTLLSTSTGTAMVVNSGGVVSGQATVQRYLDPSLNPGLGYRHYSSPITSATVLDLATAGFSPVVNPSYNTLGNTVTPFPTMYGYDEARITGTRPATQSFEQGYFSPASLSTPLTIGRSYTVNIAASEKVALMGQLNDGTVSVGTLTRGTETNSGWQLLGNPYPAPLDWKVARLNLPTGVNDAVYVYKSSGQYDGSYQFYQNGFGTLPNGLIGQMQGFFLRVTQTVPAFSFQNAWRSTSYEATTFNRPAADNRPAVQLDLISAQGTHEPAYVYFEAGATAGVDNHFDAEKLPNTTGLNLSSAAAGTSLAVNGLPLADAATIVPLHVGVPATGTYSLQAASLLNLSATDVYLHDAVTGQRINLKQQPSYSFTASNSALITNRFSLHFGAQRPLSAQSNFTAASVSVYPNPAHEQFTLLLPAVSGAAQAKVALCNVLGQAVRETTVALPAAGARTSVNVQNLPAGVYLLRVQAGTATITKQVVID